jgi:hypothetical protein
MLEAKSIKRFPICCPPGAADTSCRPRRAVLP